MYATIDLGRRLLGQPPNAVVYSWPPEPVAGPSGPIGPIPGGQTAYPVAGVQYDPTLNCMRDARGNAVCSDGRFYPPGWPKTPPPEYFSPGTTPDVIRDGFLEGEIPPPKTTYAASKEPEGEKKPVSPALLVGAGVLGTAALATAAYFLFLKK